MPPTLNSLNVEFPAEGVLARGFKVEPLGGNLYRVMEIPFLLESVSYRDVIELRPAADDIHECVTVRERAGWRQSDLLLSKEDAESERFTEILSRVTAAGGHWERALGGMLGIALPPDSTWDPIGEIASLRSA